MRKVVSYNKRHLAQGETEIILYALLNILCLFFSHSDLPISHTINSV